MYSERTFTDNTRGVACSPCSSNVYSERTFTGALSDGVLHDALFNGLRPELKANVLLLNPQTLHELIQVTKRPKKANHISSQSKSGLLEICVV